MCKFFAMFLIPFLLSPLSVFAGNANDHEFRLSPLREQKQEVIREMIGNAVKEKSCGRYIAIYSIPVTKQELVLFAVARPSGEPYTVIGRRAKDITFRTAATGDMPTVIGTFSDNKTDVLSYALYLPAEEWNEVHACLRQRRAEDDKDL
jgi:hypothetical protein